MWDGRANERSGPRWIVRTTLLLSPLIALHVHLCGYRSTGEAIRARIERSARTVRPLDPFSLLQRSGCNIAQTTTQQAVRPPLLVQRSLPCSHFSRQLPARSPSQLSTRSPGSIWTAAWTAITSMTLPLRATTIKTTWTASKPLLHPLVLSLSPLLPPPSLLLRLQRVEEV